MPKNKDSLDKLAEDIMTFIYGAKTETLKAINPKTYKGNIAGIKKLIGGYLKGAK